MDWFLTQVNTIINGLMAALPDSPFPSIAGLIPADVLSTLNWCIGIGQMLTVLAAWLVAVGLFMVFRVILAWVKVIGS